MKNFTILLLIISFNLGYSQASYVAATKKSTTFVPTKANETALISYNFVDTGINSDLSEIGATFFKDKFLILSNKKRRHTPTVFNESTNAFNNNLYCVDVDKNGNLSFPLHYSKVLDSEFNEGGVAFTADESRIFLSQTTSNESKNYQLFTAEFDLEINGQWKNKRNLAISSENYSIETPYVDRLTNTIYFASNMPNGYGGFDLYKATIGADGELENVENLGAEINSALDEKYAFTSKDQKYLYFSSNNKASLGGYDVFRASILGNNYTNKVNLGASLNTSNDEIAFIMVNNKQGYIAKNKSEDALDFDVLRFDMSQNDQNLQLEVVDLASKVKIPNAAIIINDEFGNEIYNGTTNSNGTVSLPIIPLTQYEVIAKKDGFEEAVATIPGNSTAVTVNKIISLDKKPTIVAEEAFVVENVLFEFDKFAINESYANSLDKVIAFLNEKEMVTVLISAHTDTKGSEKYNQVLSEKRAKAVYNFLVKNGIAASRISYKGFGENQPLIKCESCTAQDDQLNRRVEFKFNNLETK